MLSAAAQSLQFLLCLTGAVIFGLYTLNYGAHCFVVVLEETAAGCDEVKWPDEPILDWAWKLIFLVWLVFIGAVPAWLLVMLLMPEWLAGPLGIVPLILGVMWLVFPLFLLSALSGRSKMVVIHAGMFRR